MRNSISALAGVFLLSACGSEPVEIYQQSSENIIKAPAELVSLQQITIGHLISDACGALK